MKIVKKDIEQVVETIVKQGVVSGEEIDITTKKIIEVVWPVIDHLKQRQED